MMMKIVTISLLLAKRKLHSIFIRHDRVASYIAYLFFVWKGNFCIRKSIYLLALSTVLIAADGESNAGTVEAFNKCIERNSKQLVSRGTVRNFCISKHENVIDNPLKGKAGFKKMDCSFIRDRESGSVTSECDIVFDVHMKNDSDNYIVTEYAIMVEYTVRSDAMSVDEFWEALESGEVFAIDGTISETVSGKWIEPGGVESILIKDKEVDRIANKYDKRPEFSWKIQDVKGLEIEFE